MDALFWESDPAATLPDVPGRVSASFADTDDAMACNDC